MKLLLLGAVVLLFTAITSMLKAFKQKKIIDKSTKVKAMLIRNDCEVMPNSMMVYHAVYSYEYEDETKEFISPSAQFKPMPIGTPMVLYYNKETKEIVDPTNYVANLTLGVMGIVGVLIVSAIVL